MGTEAAILSSINMICFVLGGCQGGAKVTSIEPRYIGYGGGAVTIYGDGFSEDVFNQFDPVLGNKVRGAVQKS